MRVLLFSIINIVGCLLMTTLYAYLVVIGSLPYSDIVGSMVMVISFVLFFAIAYKIDSRGVPRSSWLSLVLYIALVTILAALVMIVVDCHYDISIYTEFAIVSVLGYLGGLMMYTFIYRKSGDILSYGN